MWRVVTLVRPHWRKFVMTIVLSIGITVAALVVPYVFGLAIDAVEAKQEKQIIVMGLALIGAGLFRSLFSAANKLVSGSLSLDVEMDIRNRIFSHVSRLDAEYFERVPSGEIVSRILIASGPVQSFLGSGLPTLMSDLIKIVLGGVVMITISPALALAGLWALPLALVVTLHYGWKVTPQMVTVQARMADITVEAETSLCGFMGTKLASTQDAWIRRFISTTRKWFDARVSVSRTVANHESAIIALPSLGLATLVVAGGFQVINGVLSLGTFVTLLGVFGVAIGPIKSAGSSLWSMQHALASAKRAFEILDAESKIIDDPNAHRISRSAIDLKFDSISHTYPLGGDSLNRIELDIAAGHNVGIIGRAGSGKSSLLSLVYRLYDPTQGAIRRAHNGQSRARFAPQSRAVRGPETDHLSGNDRRQCPLRKSIGHPRGDHGCARTSRCRQVLVGTAAWLGCTRQSPDAAPGDAANDCACAGNCHTSGHSPDRRRD